MCIERQASLQNAAATHRVRHGSAANRSCRPSGPIDARVPRRLMTPPIRVAAVMRRQHWRRTCFIRSTAGAHARLRKCCLL
ncbi:hypothetical protein, partial [Xanthomonas vasicola]|uniref:hypothetical protein n=1 Tax=Xanthomonas vasicola TaxID=56459 RepID=UPI001C11BD44